MNKKYIIGIAVLIIVIITIIAAFSMNTNTTRADDELVVAVDIRNGEPEGGFDPLTGWASGHGTEPLIQSRLYRVNVNDTLESDLATDYTTSSDLKSYEVTIRDGVKFTDNSLLTAEDVAFTYNMAKENGAVDLGTLEEATAVDDNTVRFTLNKPDSTFPYKFASLGIVPSDSYDNTTYGQNPIGSGPYKLSQWDKGQQAIFEINDDYYGEKPYYKKITNLFIDHDAAFAAAQKGEVDIIELPLSFANETIDGMSKVNISSIDLRGITLPVVASGGTTEDGSPIGNDVTSDIAIRQALNVGINRDEIIKGSYNGYGIASTTITDPSLPFNYQQTISDGDIDEAKRILGEGGWTDTDNDGIVEKDGRKAEFNLVYFTGGADSNFRQSIALQVSEQAKEFGIAITPVGKSLDEIIPGVGYSDAFVLGAGNPNPYYIYGHLSGSEMRNEYNNMPSYNNSEVDALMEQAMSQNLESSYSTWARAVELSQNDIPFVWIGSHDFLYFVSDSLDISVDTHTLFPHTGDIFGNIYDWRPVNNNSTS